MSVTEAKDLFNAQLEVFFAELRTLKNKAEIDTIIMNSLELFEDTFWPNYFMPGIKELEQKQVTISASIDHQSLFDLFIQEYTSTKLNSQKEAAIRRAAYVYFQQHNNGQSTQEQFNHDMDLYFKKDSVANF